LIATLTDVHALRSTIIVIYVVRYLLVALIHSLPVEWKFVAKQELLWIPFIGRALGCADPGIIDRSNREKSVKSLQRAAERVRGGANVIIFPEGTRSQESARPSGPASIRSPRAFRCRPRWTHRAPSREEPCGPPRTSRRPGLLLRDCPSRGGEGVGIQHHG